tara:strand:+ start:296 stop:1351 length:1056 start_codon:yes stop_codon:yes gene_type:complete
MAISPYSGQTGSDSALTAGLRKKAEATKTIRPGMVNPKNSANDARIEDYTYLQENEPLDRQIPYLPDLTDSADTQEYFNKTPWYDVFKPKDIKVLDSSKLTDIQKQNLMGLTQQNARRIVESMNPMLSKVAQKSLPDDLVSMRYEKTPSTKYKDNLGYVTGDNSIRNTFGLDINSPIPNEDREENAFHTASDGGNPTIAAHEYRHFVGEEGANKSLFALTDVLSPKELSSVKKDDRTEDAFHTTNEMYNLLVDARIDPDSGMASWLFRSIASQEIMLANQIYGNEGGPNYKELSALLNTYKKEGGKTLTPKDFEKLINLTTFAKKLNSIVIEDIKKNYDKKIPNIGAMPAK